MIEIRNLTKKYGDLTILENVSATIEKGDVISVIGPSGCGKSTLIRCLNLLEKPTAGSILVDGKDILSPGEDVSKLRQKMGMVFQSFNLYAHMMVIENIMLAPVKLKGLSYEQAYREGMEYLNLVGLAHKAHAFPDELSGGQKQRVAIARAIAMQPDILLFDEPTSALDPTMVSEVLSVIRKLAGEGMTMIIVTHEMNFARNVSNRVFFLEERGIYEDGAPEQIFDAPLKPKTKIFINRLREFSYLVEDSRFDLYEFQAKLESFLKDYMVAPQRIQRIQLVSEEILCQLLHNVKTEYRLVYSEKKDTLQIEITYEGAERNPLKEEDNRISNDIVNRMSKTVSYSYDGSVNHLTIAAD